MHDYEMKVMAGHRQQQLRHEADQARLAAAAKRPSARVISPQPRHPFRLSLGSLLRRTV